MLRPVRKRPVFVDKNNQPEKFYLDIRLARRRRGALGARIEVSRFGVATRQRASHSCSSNSLETQNRASPTQNT
jgi:hypothetical protein